MPPKKKAESKIPKTPAKTIAPAKPAWVSDQLWELGQSTAALVDSFKKPDDESAIASGCTQSQVRSCYIAIYSAAYYLKDTAQLKSSRLPPLLRDSSMQFFHCLAN